MRRSRATATIGAATLLVLLGSAPAWAGQTTPGTCDGSATPASSAQTSRPQGTTSARPAVRPVGTTTATQLTNAQQQALADMAEEEKLAGDLYVAFAALYPDEPRFARIAESEDQHLAKLQVLMTRYAVEDPTEGMVDGEFASDEFAAMYQDLLKQGSADVEAALAVGADVERLDIADLKAAAAETTARDVRRVYDNLRAASVKHLASFTR